jgi:glutamate-1-semialdehyde 2,1-aminomutase
LDAVRDVFAQNSKQIAAVIVEPIVGNAGFIRPVEGFLEGLRRITEEDGALLIFDEVMTGFRVALGGVQELKGIKPDLTTLGKVIGGGLPIGAYGGRQDIMAMVAPEGPVYQAGTLSGNPVAVASGLKTLDIIARPGAFARLAELTGLLAGGLRKVAEKHGVPFYSDSEGGMFGYFFHKGPVRSLEDAKQGDGALFKKFFWGMLDEGIYLAPSAYEAGFVSMAHSSRDIDATLAAADRVLGKLV